MVYALIGLLGSANNPHLQDYSVISAAEKTQIAQAEKRKSTVSKKETVLLIKNDSRFLLVYQKLHSSRLKVIICCFYIV